MKQTIKKTNAWIKAQNLILLLIFISGCITENEEISTDMILWYRQPGVEWLDGMPLGNGYMGAMVFGRTGTERIALNESSFWSGRPHDYNDPNAYSYFPKIKDLVFAQKFQEAEKMADEHFWGIPAAQHAYEPLGDLLLSFDDSVNVTNYRRELNMETGITSASYKIGDVTFSREVFLSYPDRVLVTRIKADKPGQISVHVKRKQTATYVIWTKL